MPPGGFPGENRLLEMMTRRAGLIHVSLTEARNPQSQAGMIIAPKLLTHMHDKQSCGKGFKNTTSLDNEAQTGP